MQTLLPTRDNTDNKLDRETTFSRHFDWIHSFLAALDESEAENKVDTNPSYLALHKSSKATYV